MSTPGRSFHVGALVRDVLEAVAMAAVLFVVLRLGLQNTVVEGPSMQPNLIPGQWLLVNKLAYRFGVPTRGDVIVFRAPDDSGKEFIKRIIAVGGETVSIRGGHVSINGQQIDEPWLPRFDGSAFGPYTVPAGSVFVLGDNRPQSNDSRSWVGHGSAIGDGEIIGRAWLSIWPVSRWGVVPADGPGPSMDAAADGSTNGTGASLDSSVSGATGG
jgi:signal peptidase I